MNLSIFSNARNINDYAHQKIKKKIYNANIFKYEKSLSISDNKNMNRGHPKNAIKRQIRRNSTSKSNFINNENKEVPINNKDIHSNRIIKVNDINNYSHNYKTKENNEVYSEDDYKSK